MNKNQKLPKGWEVKRIREVGRVVTGSTPPMSCVENYGGDFCWATAQDFKEKYIFDTTIKLSEKGKSISRVLPAGTILVTCIASIGLNAIAKKEMATNQQINAIIPNEKFDGEFIYYQISQNTNLLKKYAGSGGMMILSKSEFEKIKIAVPADIEEQKAIAGTLGIWDAGIEKLSQLIKLKEKQKKAIMQKILTGKTRLNGFSKPWKEVKLGEVCEIKKGKQLGRLEMLENGSVPVMNGGILPSGFTNSFNENENAITISEGGNSCGFVSLLKEKFWCGGHCYVLKNLKVEILFLFQILKQKEQEIMRLRVGSGLPNIQKTVIEKFSFYVPDDIDEQRAIAGTLSVCDEELALLNKKLALLREQKKSLMQQLLTGKMRLRF